MKLGQLLRYRPGVTRGTIFTSCWAKGKRQVEQLTIDQLALVMSVCPHVHTYRHLYTSGDILCVGPITLGADFEEV